MPISNTVSYDTKHLFAIAPKILRTQTFIKTPIGKNGAETIFPQELLVKFTNNYKKWQVTHQIKQD